MLRLESPDKHHQAMWEEMISTWKWLEDTSDISPSTLFKYEDYVDFLKYLEDISLWKIPGRVKASFYFLLWDDTKILWAIEIRHNLDSPILRDFWWHIGYGVRPDERSKWYATQMLALWLQEAKKLWIEKVLISCHPDNTASQKVILKNGWVYEKTVEYIDEWKYAWTYMRNWIEL